MDAVAPPQPWELAVRDRMLSERAHPRLSHRQCWSARRRCCDQRSLRGGRLQKETPGTTQASLKRPARWRAGFQGLYVDVYVNVYVYLRTVCPGSYLGIFPAVRA